MLSCERGTMSDAFIIIYHYLSQVNIHDHVCSRLRFTFTVHIYSIETNLFDNFKFFIIWENVWYITSVQYHVDVFKK